MKRMMRACACAVFGLLLIPAQANWSLNYGGTNGEGPEFQGLKSSTTYYGCIVNAGDEVIGQMTVKVSRPNAIGLYKFTATVNRLGVSKKITFKGDAQKQANGTLLAENVRSSLGNTLTISIRDCVVWGRFDGLYFEGARDFASDMATQNAVNVATFAGNYVFSFFVQNAVGPFHGNISITATVTAKGVAKVKGVLPDGQKFTSSTHICADSAGAYLPVFVQLYGGKRGGFGGFALNLNTYKNKCNGAGYWDGTGAKTARGGTVGKYVKGNGRVSGNLPIAGEHKIAPYDQQAGGNGWYWTQFNGYALLKDSLPNYTINYQGTKWTAPSNPSALKLSYKAKTGEVTGSFNVLKTDGKKQKLTVHGVYMDDLAMLNSYAKEKGALGFWIH